MEGRITVLDIFKGCLLIIAGFFIAYLAAMYVTMTSYVKEYDYPQAYGRKSLAFEAKPIMDVAVWQKNWKPFTLKDNIYTPDQDFYYTQVHLPLDGSLAHGTHTEDSSGDYIYYHTFTFTHKGRIRGHLDVQVVEGMYIGTDDLYVPGKRDGAARSYIRSDECTFNMLSPAAVSITPLSADYTAYYTGKSIITPREYYEELVKDWSVTEEFDFDEFFRIEKFSDVYPNSPEVLWDFERIVLTRRLYFEGMDPMNSKKAVASGTLLIRSYSSWNRQYASEAELEMFSRFGYNRQGYTDFIVEDYQQSERYALNLE